MLKIIFSRILTSFFTTFLIILFFFFTILCSCGGDTTEDPSNGVNAESGFNALVETANESAGDNCTTGGVKISVGQDNDENGVLDESEIISISYVCNGAEGASGADGFSLVARTSAENPGENCTNGGTLIEIGQDLNNNVSLDDDEVQTSFYICNGEDGADGTDGSGSGTNGLTSLIRTSTSTTCESGGITLEIGLDDNGNESLDDDEIDATYEICNGADGSDGSNGSNGLNSLIKTTTESPGDACSNGGIRIDVGLDTNSNGVLDTGEEIGSPVYVCDGVDGMNGTNGTDGRSPITSLNTDPSGCDNGGNEVVFGYDNDGDGIIDEILETILICNGENGTDGSGGSDGNNSIIVATAEPVGANCPAGGTFIQVGMDDNGNNTLEVGEVDSDFYICNGEDGTDGSNGNNGTDGTSIAITVTSATTCGTAGGWTFTVGYDTDNNGTIDVTIDSYTICNGTDGTDGNDGASDDVLEFYFYDGFESFRATQDTYIDQQNQDANFDRSGIIVSGGDANSRFGLLRFDGIDARIQEVTTNFEILEAAIYLVGNYSSTNENWLQVKELNVLFEETEANYVIAQSGIPWTDDRSFNINLDAATSAMDAFRLPANVSFSGTVPLQLSRSLVDSWIQDKSANLGVLIELTNNGTSQISFNDSENDDRYLRPVLYIKIKNLDAGGRYTPISDEAYRGEWQSMSYEEKLKPLSRRK